jgi:hypothetical protein
MMIAQPRATARRSACSNRSVTPPVWLHAFKVSRGWLAGEEIQSAAFAYTQPPRFYANPLGLP